MPALVAVAAKLCARAPGFAIDEALLAGEKGTELRVLRVGRADAVFYYDQAVEAEWRDEGRTLEGTSLVVERMRRCVQVRVYVLAFTGRRSTL